MGLGARCKIAEEATGKSERYFRQRPQDQGKRNCSSFRASTSWLGFCICVKKGDVLQQKRLEMWA